MDEETDIRAMPFYMKPNHITRNANIRNGHKLCKRCGGTGNVNIVTYKSCPDCCGTGIAKQEFGDSL